jgi:polysaccharide biosynthesis transport protein
MQEMHLRDIFRTLRKHRFMCIFIILATISGALVINFTTIPQYEASTKIVIDRGQSDDLTGRNSTGRDPEFFQTQYQLIRSGAVVRRALDKMNEEQGELITTLFADEKSSLGAEISQMVKSLIGRAEATNGEENFSTRTHEEEMDKLAREISKGIRVRPLDNSRMVSVSFSSSDPQFSAIVADYVVEAYIEELNAMKSDSSRVSMDWMSRKAEGERAKLKEAARQMEEFVNANDILTLENRVAVIPDKLARISSELVGAEMRRQQMQALVGKIGRIGNDPESVSAVLSDQALQSLRSQIVAAEKRIMELSGRYGSRHPEMQKAQKDLEVLNSKRNEEIARITRSIQNEYELALADERNLRAQMEETRAEAMVMNEKFARYQNMKAELDRDRGLLDSLMLRANEAGITSENQPVNLWVVERAMIPSRPSTPNKSMNLSIGMMVGIFGAIGLTFFREYLDNTVKNPDETEIVFQTPVLGTISRHRGGNGIESIVVKEPLSAFAEGYRSLRTIILSAMGDSRRLLISSPLAGEGKTATSVNLAQALAQTEMRILLIDGDLRKPRMHKILGLNNQIGLSSLLVRPFTRQTLLGSIQRGPLPNLSVMTSGPIPPNPSELLFSRGMSELMSTLEEDFDLIVCDSPPVLLVEDSRILSRIFDSVVLVTRAHQTTNEVVGRALKMLHDVKAPMLGFIINGLDQKKSDYYYHRQQYTDYQPELKKISG